MNAPISSSPWALRASRRSSSRREVTLPCQAVREDLFVLVGERTIDLSTEGMLVPLRPATRPGERRIAPVTIGDTLVVSFPLPGTWIDCEATVARIVHGRRPGDDGGALGLRFAKMTHGARAALAGFLHGRRPPLPRRGPLARLRRGQEPPQLADEIAMASPLADLSDVLDDDAVDGLGVLRAVIHAWQALAPAGAVED